MRTKGAVGKKTKAKVIKELPKAEEIVIVETKITEVTPFGNEEMINLVSKVNEIIKFINK